jgi:NAD kinase
MLLICLGRVTVKLDNPTNIMIVAKAFDSKIIRFTRQLACHLIDTNPTKLCSDCEGSVLHPPGLNHYATPGTRSVKTTDVMDGNSIREFEMRHGMEELHIGETATVGGNAGGMTVYIDSKLKTHPAFQYQELVEMFPHYKEKLKFWTEGKCDGLVGSGCYEEESEDDDAKMDQRTPTSPEDSSPGSVVGKKKTKKEKEHVDFIVTLGGDGTVLYTSWLFQNSQPPPLVPFHLGSLGFLTNFNITDIQEVIRRVVGCGQGGKGGRGVRVNMRMRLSCTVWRCPEVPTVKEKDKKKKTERKSVSINTTPTLPHHHQHNDSHQPNRIPSATFSVESTPSSGKSSSSNLLISTAQKQDVNHDLLELASPGSRISPFPRSTVDDIGALLDSLAGTLSCRAFPSGQEDEDGSEYDTDDYDEESSGDDGDDEPSESDRTPTDKKAHFNISHHHSKSKPKHKSKNHQKHTSSSTTNKQPLQPVPIETFQILNDLVVDRGPSAFMSQLELFVDDNHLTTVQADGLVISTPTGSTAYSLSAGGSIVHPEVPSILVTPICPHTLSFRPMLLPDGVELKIQVPRDSRSTAWASFDGRHRIELKQGDFICVEMSRWPLATLCDVDQVCFFLKLVFFCKVVLD